MILCKMTICTKLHNSAVENFTSRSGNILILCSNTMYRIEGTVDTITVFYFILTSIERPS
jgi:hypothetical protein